MSENNRKSIPVFEQQPAGEVEISQLKQTFPGEPASLNLQFLFYSPNPVAQDHFKEREINK